jgi:hypothetical protein
MVSFLGGQNSGTAANLLRDDQSAELWNCTRRSGHLKPRSGWKLRLLEYESEEVEEWFSTYPVQGTKIFNRVGNNEVRHIWSVGGRFFAIDIDGGTAPNTGFVKDITPTKQTATTAAFTIPAVGATVIIVVADADLIQIGYPIMIAGDKYIVISKSGSNLTIENVDGTPAANVVLGTAVVYLDANDPSAGVSYMVQAEDFLIAQDGKSLPFIYDGSTSRRAQSQLGEVPVGTVMAYGRGRLWVAIGGNKFVAGDIVYGPSGTADYDKRDAILKFTENTFLSGGGAFTAPGRITAMQFISSLDTSTGQGPLMVFTVEAICSIRAPLEREAWAVMVDPIQTISLLANGATSFYATVPTTNGDIFYRANDGLRSFFSAVREVGSWGNTPISREIGNLIANDDLNALQFCSAITFDNRLLFTGSSIHYNDGVYWRGIGALDFDGITGIFDKTPPAYDGIWFGVNVLWIYSGKYGNNERAFMAVLNQESRNELWEITKSDKFENGNGRIKWKWVSRAFKFESPLEMTRLQSCELFPREVVGEVDLTLKYRPDDYPCWFSWMAQPVCADYRKCSDATCTVPPANFRPGYRTRIPYGQPSDTDELNDLKPARLGYTHQLSLEIEGYCELKYAVLRADIIDEEPAPPVDIGEECQLIDCCVDDGFAWRSDDATESGGST